MEPLAFAGLINLDVLDLETNRLATLDKNVFDPGLILDAKDDSGLFYLYLEGNRMDCTRSLCWIDKGIKAKRIELYPDFACNNFPAMTLLNYFDSVNCY